MALEHSFDDLKAIALSKCEDAVLLLNHDRFASAYYLAGYAVEIGLKACIALLFRAEHFPDRRLVNIVHTHHLGELVLHAGLEGILKEKKQTCREFANHWDRVCKWTPDSRYTPVDANTARAMVNAVSNPQTGVLSWIREYW